MISRLLLLCLLAVTSALNAGVSARVPSRTAVTMSATGRRAAVAGLFAATLAQSASAKTIEEIAAESNKAAVADREAAAAAPVRAATPRATASHAASPPAPPHLPRRCPAQEPDADENKLLPIIAIGGGGTLLSTVFFAENLKRLGTKVASGGKDDGYTKSSNQRRR